jgi:hypothetical protein
MISMQPFFKMMVFIPNKIKDEHALYVRGNNLNTRERKQLEWGVKNLFKPD